MLTFPTKKQASIADLFLLEAKDRIIQKEVIFTIIQQRFQLLDYSIIEMGTC